jgi:hypothetical protein
MGRQPTAIIPMGPTMTVIWRTVKSVEGEEALLGRRSPLVLS